MDMSDENQSGTLGLPPDMFDFKADEITQVRFKPSLEGDVRFKTRRDRDRHFFGLKPDGSRSARLACDWTRPILNQTG